MVATAPTLSRRAAVGRAHDSSPDLAYFRRHFPETVANLGTLPRREEWLRGVWELDENWRAAREKGAEEVVVRGAPPAWARAEAEFDVIYAGAGTGLLHAAVLACRFGRRVLVVEGGAGAERVESLWNVSEDELRELESVGVFTREEVQAAVVNRGRGGFVKFHDAASRVKAEPLWVGGVHDVTLDAERLLAAASARVRASKDCVHAPGLRFVRAYVERARVTVECEGPRRERRFFTTRLFADAGGADSTVARQLAGGRGATHVCPTVGTVARGFVRGDGRDEVDFTAGDILASTEDASQHRQLVWEGFAGSAARDEYTTRLFFYDAVDSPADKSLLALFESYFERLPAFKRRGAHWRVERPLFGYVPARVVRGARERRRGGATEDRVMSLGASVGQGPLAPRGGGATLRGLRRTAHLTELALEADMLDASALGEVCAAEPRAARSLGLAEFLRPAPKSAPAAVNETLNALMAALHRLDDSVRRELFQGRLSFAALRRLFGHTAVLYPRIFARAREHFGVRGALWWLAEAAESVWSERRAGRAAGRAPEGEGPRQKFARYATAYRNGGGADEPL
jgi:lycopene cyclase CruA